MTDQQQPKPQPDKPDAPKPDAVNKEAPVPAAPTTAAANAPQPPASAPVKPTVPASSEVPPKPAAPQPPASSEPKPAVPPPPASSEPKPPAPQDKPEPAGTYDLRDKIARALESVPNADNLNKDDTRPPLPSDMKPPPPPAKPATDSQQVCPNCGHRNRPGVMICENCGTSLLGKTVMGTRDLMREQEAIKQEAKLDTSEVKAVEMAGGSTFTEEMVLRIEIDGGTTPMLVYPKQEIIMGRRDPTTGGMPDVDLTAYAGYRMGVSRRHAAIRLQDRQLHLSDLGSSNGTFINGTRLTAHRPYQLRDGDEIRLGQMILRVFFQASKDRK